MKEFNVYWTDKVKRHVVIKAENKEDAFNKWEQGEYQPGEVWEEEVECIQEDWEVKEDIEENK